jgi:hypothetical protein
VLHGLLCLGFLSANCSAVLQYSVNWFYKEKSKKKVKKEKREKHQKQKSEKRPKHISNFAALVD